MKTVSRTWFNKKTNSYVTKTYTYDKKYSHKSTRGYVLKNKNKINYKNVNKLLNSIYADSSLSDAEKVTMEGYLQSYLHSSDVKKMTSNGFFGRFKDDSISRMITNMGYEYDDLAQMLNVDINEVMNPDNWNGTVFKNMYQLEFSYTESIIKRLNNG